MHDRDATFLRAQPRDPAPRRDEVALRLTSRLRRFVAGVVFAHATLGLTLVPGAAVIGCSGSDGRTGADAGSTNDAGVAADDAASHRSDSGFLSSDAGVGDDGGASADGGVAEPIVATPGAWTWVDVAGARCDDGSPTGIGVNVGSSASDVLVYFAGGGACWSYETCFTLHTATSGPFGRAQLEAVTTSLGGSIFDRSESRNPFRTWTYVLVPYCTGDLHGGRREVTYMRPPDSDPRTYLHVGAINVDLARPRLAATFGSAERVVIAGSSAGGAGALFHYEGFRRSFPDARMALLDDSFPAFVGDDMPLGLRTAWFTQWGLAETLSDTCGATCMNDLSRIYRVLVERHPADKLALLSSGNDRVIQSYFMLTAPQFQAALMRLTTEVLDPAPAVAHFYVDGQSHTMLTAPGSAAFTSGGVPLWTWLGDFVP